MQFLITSVLYGVPGIRFASTSMLVDCILMKIAGTGHVVSTAQFRQAREFSISSTHGLPCTLQIGAPGARLKAMLI